MKLYPSALSENPSERIINFRTGTYYPNLRKIRIYMVIMCCIGGFSGAIFAFPSIISMIYSLGYVDYSRISEVIKIVVTVLILLWVLGFLVKLGLHVYDLLVDCIDLLFLKFIRDPNQPVKGS